MGVHYGFQAKELKKGQHLGYRFRYWQSGKVGNPSPLTGWVHLQENEVSIRRLNEIYRTVFETDCVHELKQFLFRLMRQFNLEVFNVPEVIVSPVDSCCLARL